MGDVGFFLRIIRLTNLVNEDHMRLEQEAFTVFIGLVTVLTAWRTVFSPATFGRIFCGTCVVAQLCALYGLIAHDTACIATSHISFATAMWIGCIGATGVELWMIAWLSAVAWASRRALRRCMFSHARQKTTRDDVRHDLIYVLPLGIALLRASHAS